MRPRPCPPPCPHARPTRSARMLWPRALAACSGRVLCLMPCPNAVPTHIALLPLPARCATPNAALFSERATTPLLALPFTAPERAARDVTPQHARGRRRLGRLAAAHEFAAASRPKLIR